MTQRTHTHFSGSVCVVELAPGALNPGSNGAYLDVREMSPTHHVIEVVRGGQVVRRVHVEPRYAPERIVSIMKGQS